MPVQINEMVIRAHVREPADNKKQPPAAAHPPSLNKDELIRECTEKIMEMLNRKNER
jgi:hypothetical protein